MFLRQQPTILAMPMVQVGHISIAPNVSGSGLTCDYKAFSPGTTTPLLGLPPSWEAASAACFMTPSCSDGGHDPQSLQEPRVPPAVKALGSLPCALSLPIPRLPELPALGPPALSWARFSLQHPPPARASLRSGSVCGRGPSHLEASSYCRTLEQWPQHCEHLYLLPAACPPAPPTALAQGPTPLALPRAKRLPQVSPSHTSPYERISVQAGGTTWAEAETVPRPPQKAGMAGPKIAH